MTQVYSDVSLIITNCKMAPGQIQMGKPYGKQEGGDIYTIFVTKQKRKEEKSRPLTGLVLCLFTYLFLTNIWNTIDELGTKPLNYK